VDWKVSGRNKGLVLKPDKSKGFEIYVDASFVDEEIQKLQIGTVKQPNQEWGTSPCLLVVLSCGHQESKAKVHFQ
jgi:hypothetical protein